MDIEKIIEW